MIESVVAIGAIITAINVIAIVILSKVTSNASHAVYYSSFFFALVGILTLFVASIAPRVDIFGAGFGGWGIALMFSGAIGFIVAAIIDTYRNTAVKAVTEKY